MTRSATDVRVPQSQYARRGAPGAASLVAAANDAAWQSSRGAVLPERLRAPTIRWLMDLPDAITPYKLAAWFPRVANLIALEWSNRAACTGYLESLVRDVRGGRHGFPPAVNDELRRLRTYRYTGAVEPVGAGALTGGQR